MSDNTDDRDFEFFDASTPFIASSSPGTFLGHSLAGDERESSGLESPLLASPKHESSGRPFLDSSPQALSTQSLDSPSGSFQDSSSDSSRYKRKSSSESSRSAFIPKDGMMTDTDMGDWKVDDILGGNEMETYSDYQPSSNLPLSSGVFDFSDKIMENDFDFDSAASSPNNFARAPLEVESPEMPTIKYNTPQRNSPSLSNPKFGHNSRASVSLVVPQFLCV
jgi:hypothetical protein